MKKMDENMQRLYMQYGVYDYYLELKKFAFDFVNRNYPMTTDDIHDVIEGKDIIRNEVLDVLVDSMYEALDKVLEANIRYVENLNKGIFVKPMTVDDERKLISNCKQYMLKCLWEYQNGKGQVNGRGK